MLWRKSVRTRREFEAELQVVVERVERLFADVSSEVDSLAQQFRVETRGLPGLTERCKRCGGSLFLKRTKYGRGRHQQRSDWLCRECGLRHTVKEAHQKLARLEDHG